MDKLSVILDDKGRTVHTVSPGTTVLDAVDAMCARHVGALVVRDGGRLAGVFTERDLMRRVILARRDPAVTLVGDVMTREPMTVPQDCTIGEAMNLMTEHRCRHLPVVRDGELLGLVSIGDLVRWVTRAQEFELRLLQEYITGARPG
ncbi:MAG: CBS domain-containing protein [Deltaproteobacteria bacterium]|nr:CBS domain-containing protein [Deltaproteobacteria bacterium]